MSIFSKRALAALAGTAVLVGAAVAFTGATPANAAQSDPTGPTDVAPLSPSSGNSGTTFAISFPSPVFCPGDATAGYKVWTYLSNRADDGKSIVFGPTQSGFISQLQKTDSSFVSFDPGSGDGQISAVSLTNLTFSKAAFSTLISSSDAPKELWLGVACSYNDGTTRETAKYWQTPITVKYSASAGANNFTWQTGFVPGAPTIGSRTAGDGQVQVAFTPATAITGNVTTTGYTVVVKDSTCTTDVTTASGASSPITVTGLTNGTTYCFAVKATNAVGDSALSSTGTSTPNPAARGAVTGFTATPGVEEITLNWVAPSPAPTTYTISVSPNTGTGSFVAGPYTGVTGLSKTISGLTAGTLYTFTITPSAYSDTPTGGGSFTGTAAQVSGTPNSNQVIGQNNSATRPTGSLLIYVKCGVYGALDSFTATSGVFPGFPKALSSETATGTGTEAGGGSSACNLDMGTAQLVRLADDASLGGNFFTADGRLSQITVLDTRDSDLGWSVTATAGDFTGSVSGSISGNYLGWVPKVTATSAAYGTYDQVATAGAQVLPGTGVSSGDGLGDATPNVLASAAAGAGLGEATLDGRLLLLIPVSADAQVYTGSLTLSLA